MESDRTQGNDISDRQAKHMAAIKYFEREMDALMHPVTKEPLLRATQRLLENMMEYSPEEAATRTIILDEQRDIPTDDEIDNEAESVPELLKVGLFDKLPEEYIVRFGMDEFDKWIGPFIRSVIDGHVEGSSSYEHEQECSEDRFCPAEIIVRFIDDQLNERPGKIKQNIGYFTHPNEMVFMKTRIYQELAAVGLYDEIDVKDVAEDYRDWLDDFDDYAVTFNEEYFVL